MPRAPATWLACAACVGVYLSIHFRGDPETWEQWERWGVLTPDRIRGGAWWGLWSSCFVHVSLWHLLFNLFWLWDIGTRLESSIGTMRYVLLSAVGGGVASLAQIAMDSSGHGYSGIGYALFGFAWIARKRHRELSDVVNERTVASFLIWFAWCAVATQMGMVRFANAAHAGGLVCGVLIAFAFVEGRWWGYAGLAAVLALLGAAQLWRPWSPDWTAQRAWAAHKRGEFEVAERWYRAGLVFGQDAEWTYERLAHLFIASGERAKLEAAIAQLAELDKQAADDARDDDRAHLQLKNSAELGRGDSGDADLRWARLASYEWRVDEARKLFARHLASHPDDVGTLTALAHVALLDPDSSEAELRESLATAHRAIELSKHRDQDSLHVAAELCMRLHDAARACELANEISALYPRRSAMPEYLRNSEDHYRAVRDGME